LKAAFIARRLKIEDGSNCAIEESICCSIECSIYCAAIEDSIYCAIEGSTYCAAIEDSIYCAIEESIYCAIEHGLGLQSRYKDMPHHLLDLGAIETHPLDGAV
jgi:hypothetical protein